MLENLPTIYHAILTIHNHILDKFQLFTQPPCHQNGKFEEELQTAVNQSISPHDHLIGTIYYRVEKHDKTVFRFFNRSYFTRIPTIGIYYLANYLYIHDCKKRNNYEHNDCGSPTELGINLHYSDPKFIEKLDEFITKVAPLTDNYGNRKAPPIARWRTD